VLEIRVCIRPSVPLSGGASESVFPKGEAWLQQDDHENALRVLAQSRPAQGYRSVIDFLFCTVFPWQQQACQRFYDDKGPALRDASTDGQLAAYERWLLAVLEGAHAEWCKDRRRSWTKALRRRREQSD